MITRELCSFFIRAIVYIRTLTIFSCLRNFLQQLTIMPQQLNVLRCYSCKMYQVHIAKKSRKWQCKICNEKQSIHAIYFCGTGADCRNYVQAQNILGASSATRPQENFPTTVIDGWGLDCEADSQSEDPCDCNQRKMAIAKLSQNLKVHSLEQENDFPPCKRHRNDTEEQRSCSLPIRDSPSTRESRSQSFPQSKRTKRPSKWEKFLEGEKSRPHSTASSQPVNKAEVCDVPDTEYFWTDGSNVGVAQTLDEEDDETIATGNLEASRVDSDSSSSSRQIGNNVFDDLTDELDTDLDF